MSTKELNIACRAAAVMRKTALTVMLGLVAMPAMAVDIVTIVATEEAFDLDAGAVLGRSPGKLAEAEGADIFFAYNADRVPHTVVFLAGDTVEMAFVTNAGFDRVGEADIADLTFNREVVDLSFSADHCVVIRTDQGAIYKIGNAVVEDDFSITFNYAAL